jgi:hypothetical protein
MGQMKDYKIGICCFSAKHAALENLLLNADLNAEHCFGLWLPNQ